MCLGGVLKVAGTVGGGLIGGPLGASLGGALGGAAGGALDSKSAKKQAAQQLAIYRQMLSKQQALSDRLMNVGDDLLEREAAEAEYVREMNDLMREWTQANRTRDIANQDRLSDLEYGEYDRLTGRQSWLDGLATDQRDWERTQYGMDRALAAGERGDALSEYRAAQAIAELERMFEVNAFNANQTRLDQEQQYDLEDRQRIIDGAGGMSDAIQNMLNELGGIGAAPVMTQEALDAEIKDRTDLYMADMDRAATKVASMNESDLMNTGMDISSSADQRRADITAKLSQEYANTRKKAYDDSLAYMSGKQNTMLEGFRAELARRSASLGEVAQPFAASLDYLQNLRGVRSATQDFRGMRSANNFDQYSIVPSARVDYRGLSNGMSPTINVSTPTYRGSPNPVMPYQSPAYTSAGSVYGTAGGLLGGASAGQSGIFQSANSAARSAGSASGEAWGNLANVFDEFAQDKGWW